jgi:hypothetical protein
MTDQIKRNKRPTQTIRLCMICYELALAPVHIKDHEPFACSRCMDRR